MIRRVFAALGAFILVPVAAQAQGDGAPIVGIAQMQDLTGTGQDETFSTMLETALISSGKFRVIERSRLADLLAEQGLADGGITTTDTPGRTGGFEGVDYLIYGSITQISAVNRQNIGRTLLGGVLGGGRANAQGCHNTRVRMEADIRITDTNSGEVRYATRISEEQESAAVCDGGTQIDSSALLRGAADNISTGLVTSVFPIQVAAIQGDGTMILNYGEGAVERGDFLMLFGESVEIPDPSGGTILVDGEEYGAILVTDVQNAFSRATPVSTFSAEPAVGTVARPIDDEDLIEDLEREQRRRRR